MSWTESFPVLTEEMIDDFEQLSTPLEKSELQRFYEVKEILNPQTSAHLVSISLFSVADPDDSARPESSSPSDSTAKISPVTPDKDAWIQLIQSLLEDIRVFLEKSEGVVVRVYLAGDLDFLAPALTKAGCEVYLMGFFSGNPAPASTWRLLALSEPGRLVTILAPQMLRDGELNLERTHAMQRSGLSCWRQPLPLDHDGGGKVIYRPFFSSQMGFKGGWEIQKLLQAFVWHSMRGLLPMVVEMPGCSPRPVSSGYWPDQGFEEWFLAVAMYPRVAAEGMLTFVPAGFNSSLLLLDIEYATWSNPQSELIIFPAGTCCAPPGAEDQSKASSAQPDEQRLEPAAL